MQSRNLLKSIVLLALILTISSCGRIGNLFEGEGRPRNADDPEVFEENVRQQRASDALRTRRTIWDLFTNREDANVTVEVNKYIWNATLDILDFMPIQAADPFSGVIVYGYGTPPGSGRAYRATVYIQDPALDARSLRVALATRSGPAPLETVRAIEDAILTRARQMRIADERL